MTPARARSTTRPADQLGSRHEGPEVPRHPVGHLRRHGCGAWRQRHADALRRGLFGIETGVIDGAENNFPSYDTAKHFEVAKNYSLDEHTILPEVFVMNKAAFDKLTPEDQAIFKQAAKDSVGKQRELWAAKVAESRKIVEAGGAQITTPEKQGFIDAMKPVYEKHVTDDVLKKMVADVQATQ
jgi:TRAP-type C4-dicarboxylate transport system substrate-binding protein